jgi:DNA-binding CsgD family transcriptional regulator
VQRAVGAFCAERISTDDALRWLPIASRIPGDALWDYKSWDLLGSRHIRLAREAGALAVLPVALSSRACMKCFGGDLATAASLRDEAEAVGEAARVELSPYGALTVAAWRGHETEAKSLMEATVDDAMSRGEGLGLTLTQWAAAVLYNGLGRYEEALTAARQASKPPEAMGFANWILVELIEAAVRSDEHDAAAESVELLAQTTAPSGTDWACGIEARSRALISDGQQAERLYHKAIERLGRAGLGAELARAHLVFGEWLRRDGRRLEAREQLRTAHEMFGAMGAEAFEARAGRELVATGERARKRRVETRDDLTSQEAQIARFARDGLSNPEIASRLFISPRTVEYHLGKVFAKLDISSRHELRAALRGQPQATQTSGSP